MSGSPPEPHWTEDDEAAAYAQQTADLERLEWEADQILTRVGQGKTTVQDEEALRLMFRIPRRV